MRPLLKQAQAERYGVAAYNMIDYNSARSIVEGAAQLEAPVIAQVSVKTVKHWGYKPIATSQSLFTSITATISKSSSAVSMPAGHRSCSTARPCRSSKISANRSKSTS
jgi:fructose/tagatose bisphosphate aldolase